MFRDTKYIYCSVGLYKSCSTSKVSDNSFENKKLVSSCLLCDSQAVDASFHKHFDLTRPDNFVLGTSEENSNYYDFFNNCEYYDISSLNNVLKHKKDDLFIMHFNMQNLQKNIDKLITLLANLFEMSDIIAISETKITYGQPIVNVDITVYGFLHCDSITKADGVGFYVK